MRNNKQDPSELVAKPENTKHALSHLSQMAMLTELGTLLSSIDTMLDNAKQTIDQSMALSSKLIEESRAELSQYGGQLSGSRSEAQNLPMPVGSPDLEPVNDSAGDPAQTEQITHTITEQEIAARQAAQAAQESMEKAIKDMEQQLKQQNEALEQAALQQVKTQKKT
ncbi:hypothetical protein EYS14_19465 [Alteromonadaceae bacterium M269]|nr:hypothetical protein EYS14_19465 [Alteromonadaceae bacterium M269]